MKEFKIYLTEKLSFKDKLFLLMNHNNIAPNTYMKKDEEIIHGREHGALYLRKIKYEKKIKIVIPDEFNKSIKFYYGLLKILFEYIDVEEILVTGPEEEKRKVKIIRNKLFQIKSIQEELLYLIKLLDVIEERER